MLSVAVVKKILNDHMDPKKNSDWLHFYRSRAVIKNRNITHR